MLDTKTTLGSPAGSDGVTLRLLCPQWQVELVDGVEAKAVIIEQFARALEVIEHHAPARIATLGGECAVSVAPFSSLALRYGEDLAILWMDSHPDIGTPASAYSGVHAMAVAR